MTLETSLLLGIFGAVLAIAIMVLIFTKETNNLTQVTFIIIIRHDQYY